MKDHLLLWIPRAAGILLALFLGVFALDAFHGQGLVRAIAEFLIHLLPSYVLIGIVVLAWNRPLVGAIAFTLLAALYAAMAYRHPNWIIVIGGSLMLPALLYLASWLRFRARPSP